MSLHLQGQGPNLPFIISISLLHTPVIFACTRISLSWDIGTVQSLFLQGTITFSVKYFHCLHLITPVSINLFLIVCSKTFHHLGCIIALESFLHTQVPDIILIGTIHRCFLRLYECIRYHHRTFPTCHQYKKFLSPLGQKPFQLGQTHCIRHLCLLRHNLFQCNLSTCIFVL